MVLAGNFINTVVKQAKEITKPLNIGAMMRLGEILVDVVDGVHGHEDVDVHQLGDSGVITRE